MLALATLVRGETDGLPPLAAADVGDATSAQAPAVTAEPGGDTAAESPTTTMPALPVPEAHEKVDTNAPALLTAVRAPKKQQWEAERGGFLASRLHIARRLSDRPERLLSRREGLPRKHEDFLWRVARDTWTGLQAYTDRENGLVIDNVRVVGGLVPPLALRVGDYTNITNIGLQLAAIVAARRMGLLSDADARQQSSRVLDTLATLERHDGYFFNYYDTTTLEPTSSFLSFVDTAWLMAGLIVTRQGFPELEKTVNELLEPLDLHWFYDASTGLMSHGYYAHRRLLSTYQYGTFYTEARLGSVIALGKGDAPVSHWYAMTRAIKPRCVEAECPKFHRLRYFNAEGRERNVTHFRWRSFDYVPSWGGSMFEALMPRLVLDENRWAPQSLGVNGQAHALLQKSYATEALGYPVWGMSPCISPATGRYAEFGVQGLGSHGYAENVVTPHAAALALAVAPDDAVEALMEMARRYDIYGPYGFYDAVEPATGKVAYDQLALDQLMLFLAVANHLTGDEIPELFASDPWIRPALGLLAEERFFY
ncbi:MAG: glucoamylase family protein [Candidatus Binatia bacterium]